METFRSKQVRQVVDRADCRGHEQRTHGGVRPWLVLSKRHVHDDKLFIACPSTQGRRDGSAEDLLVDPFDAKGPLPIAENGKKVLLKGSRIDVQQIWTFLQIRDRTTPPVPLLPAQFMGPVLEGLAKHLKHSQETWETNTEFSAGKIVWVKLRAVPAFESLSDLATIREKFEQLTGVLWPYEDRLLCCMVLATDIPVRKLGTKPPFELITVVPLVNAPNLLNPKRVNPMTVKQNGGPALSAMTQLLLTVDYTPKWGRVATTNGTLQSWRVDKAEYEKIAAEVKSLIGVM